MGRPLENTREAYEQAWAAGFKYAECDVLCTKDGRIILNHDSTMKRMVARTQTATAGMDIQDLKLRDVFKRPLKSGVRPPLLREVLDSAQIIDENAQLVVEIKSMGGVSEDKVGFYLDSLIKMLRKNIELIPAIVLFMSFDNYMAKEFKRKYESELKPEYEEYRKENGIAKPHPLVMQLTCSRECPGDEGEPEFNIDDDNWRETIKELTTVDEALSLDGVYIHFQAEVRNEKGMDNVRELSKTTLVGVWGDTPGGDPDCLEEGLKLKELGVKFINTDLPVDYFNQGTETTEAPLSTV